MSPQQADIKAAIARIFFDSIDAARIEDEAFSSGNPNCGALNDFGMELKRRAVQSLLKFKDCASDDFVAALQYFGPYAAFLLGSDLSGLHELVGFNSLLVAFAKIGDPSITNEAAQARVNACASLEIKNPHMLIFESVKDRMQKVLSMPDPDSTEIEDTGDGLTLRLMLDECRYYTEMKFCSRLFASSIAELKKPDISPEQHAHAALILATACRLLPENGLDPLSDRLPTTQDMIAHSIDKFYRRRNDDRTTGLLTDVLKELDQLPDQNMAKYPTRFASRIYEDILLSKVYQALEHDGHFALSGSHLRLRTAKTLSTD